MTKTDIDYGLLLEGLRSGMKLYIEQGVPPGDFLQAVLRNDLVDAIGRADPDNLLAMRQITRFLYNEAPIGCWGSRAAMQAWTRARKTA